jgi:AcrR family transcriptional regulator
MFDFGSQVPMDTKQRILDAAERLFAEHGFDGASLRAITAIAGVNLAAVNYHFRSKEALIQAVLARKLGPINRRRLEMLDKYEADAGSKPVPLHKLVHAMIDPMVRPVPSAAGMSFGTVMGRVYLERNAQLQRLLVAELQEIIRRFSAALHRSLPALTIEEVYWRLFFTIGTVSHTLAAPGLLELVSGGACDPSDLEQTLLRLKVFVAAGLKAPRPARGTSKERRKRQPARHGPAPGRHHVNAGGTPASLS